MPRDTPIGNQADNPDATSLLVNFRCDGSFGEVYYPQVGSENHTGGSRWRLGVFVPGRGFAWLDDPAFVQARHMGYKPNQMVTDFTMAIPSLQLSVAMSSVVDASSPVLLNTVVVTDTAPGAAANPIAPTVFLLATPAMGGIPAANTATFDPQLQGILAFRRNRYMLMTGFPSDVADAQVSGYSVKWRDACPWQETGDIVRPQCEQGQLDGDGTRHGCVEGAIAVQASARDQKTAPTVYTADLVLSFGRSEDEVVANLDSSLAHGGLKGMRHRTEKHWELWLSDKLAVADASGLGPEIGRLYARSLFVLRTHADNQGAFLAAIDWDVHREQMETYSYCWMRDAGFACEAMSRNNCPELSEALFRFARKVFLSRTRNGKVQPYFMQKYTSDANVGSTWMPRVDGASGVPRLPIQQDETASLIIAVGRHQRLHPKYDTDRSQLVYEMVFPAADWICDWRLPCGLPRPSHDLWEERDGIHLQTVAVVYGALFEAAGLACDFGDSERAERYASVANEIGTAARKEFVPSASHPWLPRLRRVDYTTDKLIPVAKDDRVLDAGGAASVFLFACPSNSEPLFPMSDIVLTMEAVRKHLWVSGGVGGVARYQLDPYCADPAVNYSEQIPGNPWIICTLWLAEWDIARAKTEQELSRAAMIFRWVAKNAALESGILAEQLHPVSGKPLGVSPLGWSHSTFVSAVQRYQQKRLLLKRTVVN